MILAQSMLVPLAALLLAQNSPPPKPGAPPQGGPAMGSPTTPIGMSVTIEVAKKAASAAAADARKNGWFMAIAVVDPAGTLVYYEKADNTQLGSAVVAIDKARSAALYKRPTKVFSDLLAKGPENVRILKLTGAMPVEGGVPIIVDGKLIGGLGVSGDKSENDNQCAMAGVGALAQQQR
jgi:glc operon protein GlcG